MEVASLRTDTMEHVYTSAAARETREYRENWTTGGLVAFVLVLPAVLALLVAPAVVLGAVVVVVGVKLAGRVRRRRRRRVGRQKRPTTAGRTDNRIA